MRGRPAAPIVRRAAKRMQSHLKHQKLQDRKISSEQIEAEALLRKRAPQQDAFS